MNQTPKESKELLEGMGVGLNAHNLVYYAQEGAISEVQHLVNAGIHPDSKSQEGLIPLNRAIANGHIEIVKFLLERAANPNILDGNGNCPLSTAIGNDRTEIFQLLIDSGADVNGPSGCNYPPIITASYSGKIDFIEALAHKGANIEVIDKDGDRPIKVAYQQNQTLACDKLVELGAKPLSEEEKKKEQIGNKLLELLKKAYSKNSYIFLGVNLFCFIIIFFVLDKNTGGGIGTRIFTFLFCSIIGGFLGMWWSRKREGDVLSWYKYGAGTFLVIFTLITWSGNGLYDENGNYHSPNSGYSSGSSSSGQHNCGFCGKSFSGNGWSTVGGEQFQQSSWSGSGYCSKSCAYDSQPAKWKY